MHLDKSTFGLVIKHTPLVSIDLIIENRAGEYLLGLRKNRPAKDYWFVPGGRIRKDERLEDAFCRITKDELGIATSFNKASFLGFYEHFYTDNVFVDDAYGTHYVVLGFNLSDEPILDKLPKIQHFSFRWFSKEEIIQNEQVHANTKAYF